MSINTKDEYIEIGTDFDSEYTLVHPLVLPVPIDLPFSNEFLADAERNANGTMMIEEIGRTQHTFELKWNELPNVKLWEMNRWFKQYGYSFYVKYFNHAEGRVMLQKFYRGNVSKATPNKHVERRDGLTVPTGYKNVSVSFIDMGDTALVLAEVEI